MKEGWGLRKRLERRSAQVAPEGQGVGPQNIAGGDKECRRLSGLGFGRHSREAVLSSLHVQTR